MLGSIQTPGKHFKRELKGYWSLRIGRHRIIYRPDDAGAEIVALGPRKSIYEEMLAAPFPRRCRKKQPDQSSVAAHHRVESPDQSLSTAYFPARAFNSSNQFRTIFMSLPRAISRAQDAS